MHRTLLIGLDGATFTVLDALMAEGVMPNLKAFAERGARAPLASTPNPLTPPAWTSLVTGRTPGHHGIFDFIRVQEGPEGLYFTLNTSFDVRCETIWSIVSRQGGTVTALNFPVSYPPQPVNGYVVPGFVAWKHMRRAVHPPGFYDTLKTIPGFDVKELSIDMNQELKSIQWIPEDQYEAWITHHSRREKQWFGIARRVLAEHPTDLIAVLFDGVDKLEHLCWRYLDPELFPAKPTPTEAKIRGWCLDYFRLADDFIGELVALAGPEARVFMASDHGFGATHEVFYANVWLERNGYLAWAETASKDELGQVSTDRIKSHVVGIDWTRTTAYALTPSSNGIFIRVADAPGKAGVPPAQYESFRRELAARLADVRHPETGARLIQRVMTREEAFPGAAAEQAPDLTLVLADYGFLSVLNADVIVRPRPEPAGTHRPHGIFFAGGAGIVKGQRLDTLSLIDVAPTLLHSLGLPIPSDLEGRVAVECYEDAALDRLPIRFGEPTRSPEEAAPGAAASMSAADEEKVMDRLKALGYVE